MSKGKAGELNASLPVDQLNKHVEEYARKLACVYNKLRRLDERVINKTQDTQDFREAISIGIEIDIIGHLAEQVTEINRQIR